MLGELAALVLGSVAVFDASGAEPQPITADAAHQWGLYVAPLPQKMEITAEMRLDRDRIRVSAPQTDDPVITQAIRELRACVGAGSAAEGAFRILLQLGGPGASALDSVPNKDQAYRVLPEAENAGLRIVARTPVGLLYGVKTLTQLISARSTGAQLCIPMLRVTDWPDIPERGFWGADSFRHLRWIGAMKFNVVEQIAAVWVTPDGKGHAGLKPGREPMIEEGPRYGILPLPAVLHLEQLSGKGLFEAYPELKAQGGQEGAICYSQTPIVDVLADWIVALGSLPNVSDVDVWMTENLHGKGGCRCKDCQKHDRSVLEVRAILAAWRKAKQRLPHVGLRVLLSEETFRSNHLVLAELPKEVKLVYYHSLRTYTAQRREMVYPLMEKFAAQGRWLGTCPQLTGVVGPASPFSGAHFVHYRMKEFCDKRVSGFTAYVTPLLSHARFNVEAAAEWSWNVGGRTTREFALSYAVRHGIEPPELFADWSEAIGPVAWDLYGSEWPAGERRRSGTPVVEALRTGSLPKLGTVRGDLYPHPWGQFHSERQIRDGVAAAGRALALAQRIGRPEIIEHSRVIQGYIRSLAAVFELGKIVGPDGVARENRDRAAAAVREFIDACRQAETALRAWSKLVAPEIEPEPGSRYWQIAEVLKRNVQQMGALAADLGIADSQARLPTLCDLAVAELNKETAYFADGDDADPAAHPIPVSEDANALPAPAPATAEGTDVITFQKTLAAMRARHYRQRTVDIIKTGFRPVGGKVADFAVARRDGRYHFFYIERRLQEGTPFYPGHEIYFGHASTADFVDWRVHDPVMLVRPGTWEEAHVWAPCILRRGREYVMAYTGVNRHLSQNIGLASSTDLFHWSRWETNPISPCKDRPWAHWREDAISSCRDPSLLEHDGRYWMIYTANTRQGAACIALASTPDFRQWQDHGPICVGPATGYEARLEGGHPQGSLESANLLHRRGKWYLLVKAKVRDSQARNWVIASDRMDAFDFDQRREFWPGAFGVEVVCDQGDRSLLATFTDGHIRLGVADWTDPKPTARFLSSQEELAAWLTQP